MLAALISDNSICVYNMIDVEKIADLEFRYTRINRLKFDDRFEGVRIYTAFNSGDRNVPIFAELKSRDYTWDGIEFTR